MSRSSSTSDHADGTGASALIGGGPMSPGEGGTAMRGTTSFAASGSSTGSRTSDGSAPNVASKAATKSSKSECCLQSAARRARKDSERDEASTAASARCAVIRSPTPTRAPPARIEATKTASRAVTKLDIGEHPRCGDTFDVLAHLQRDAERDLEVGVVESDERTRP